MIRVLLIAGVFLALSVPSAFGAGAATTRPKLVVGGDHDCPPYEFLENGKPTGFDVELLRAVADVMGFEAEFRLGPWAEVKQDLEQGRIDALAGMYYSADRSTLVDFSVPHTMVTPGIFVRTDSPIGSYADIQGKEIIVQKEDIIHDALRRNGLASRIVPVREISQALKLLDFGNHDCAVLPSRLQGEHFIQTFRLANVRALKTELPPLQYCFAVRKGDQGLLYQLDEGLKILKVNGKYREIYEKWFGVYERKGLWESTKNYLVVVSVVIAVLFTAGFAWFWSLRRQVRIRTAELRESEEKFRVLAETSPAAICVYQGEHNVYFNTAMTHLIGYTEQECLQMKFWDWTHPDYKELVRERGLARQRGEPVSSRYELKILTKNGDEKWLFLSAGRIEYKGMPAGIVTFVDISDRKRMEEELQRAYGDLEKRVEERTAELARATEALMASEKEKSLILNNTDALVIYYDLDMNILWANKAAGDSVNMTPEELRKRRCWEAWHQRRKPCSGCPVISTRDTGQPGEGEVRTPDERVWFIRACPVRNETGQLIGIVEFTQDITERKRAEEELRKSEAVQRKLASELAQKNKFLRTLIDAIPDLIFYKDCNRAYLGCNRAFEDFVGRSEKDLIGCTDLEIFSTDAAVSFRETDLEILSTEESRRNEEWIDYPDGHRVLLETLKTPFFDLDGEILGVVGISRDITERKEAEEALRESESRVRRKLESIIDPEGDTGELDLADILDTPAIKALMDDLFRLTGLKMSIIDLKGRVLADVGWQDICSKFHRNHPETLKRCHESDTDLTVGVPQGEFRTYRCKNNMWHLVTPIIVGGRHMGNLFLGQFFFAGEELDYDLFRSQARKYGFPEEEYIAALEAVPRHREELVNLGKAVFLRLTDMISKLSYANIKLAHSLAERDQLTAVLRQANMVVENSPVVLFRWKGDDEWPVELVSGNILQFGYTPEDFLSGAITYSSIIHPDDLEQVTWEARDFCNGGADQFHLEYRIMTKGGDFRWVNEHTHVERDSAGDVKNFEGIVIDVTERKRMEEALRESKEMYRSIVDAYDGFIYIISQDYRIEFMNQRLIERTGRDAAGELCYKVMHDRDSPCTWCLNDRVFAGEAIHWDMLSPKDNRWYEVLNVPIRHADGSMSKHSVMVDIHDRKLFEEELQRQKKLLQELNETLERRVGEEVAKNREKDILLIQQNRQAAMGDLLEHIAHQWKQPLTVVSLLVQNLWSFHANGELTAERIRETINKTTDLLEHMAQTIEVFRDFYRPDKEKTVFSISDSVDNALAFISPALKYQSIAVDVEVDPRLMATGYPREYTQVLLNILSNARDVLRERNTERPKIWIRGIAEGGSAVVTITDNAGGIPEAISHSIFDLYVTTKAASGGTGIGLHMSKNIIEKNMDGSLTARNTEAGAQFRIAVSMPESRFL